jgi:hypothetical protein
VAASSALGHLARAGAAISFALIVGCGLAVTGQATDALPGQDGATMHPGSSGAMSDGAGGGGGPYEDGPGLTLDATAPADAHHPELTDAHADAQPARDAGPADTSAPDAASACPNLHTCCTWIAVYTDSGVSQCEATAATNDPTSCASLLVFFQSAYLCLGL